MASKTIVIDTFYPKIKSCFSNKANEDKLKKIISRYIDSNAAALTTVGPVKQTFFLENEKKPVYDLVGLDGKTISAVAKQSKDLSRGVNASDPFCILLALIIRYFHIAKKENESVATCLYMCLRMYPSVFSKYFKYEPNEQIMAFTISNLTQKYKLKQQGTVLAAFKDTCLVCDKHYDKNIIRGTDKDIADYINAVKTRLNALIKNICSEFMKQHDNKRYLNYEEDNEDPENYSQADSNSLAIQRISSAVLLQLSVSGPNDKWIDLAARTCVVSKNDLRSSVHSICRDKKNKDEIKEVVDAILYDFLFNGENQKELIESNKFFIYAMDTYRKSNTINTNILKIKEILDKWLGRYSETYRKTNHVGTLNAFRKSLYLFFVFTIQKTRV